MSEEKKQQTGQGPAEQGTGAAQSPADEQGVKKDKPVFYEEPNPASSIKHVIAVMSGKGGVGKSLVTALSACAMQQAGYQTAILDADITGPSIPKSFGLGPGLVYEGQQAYPQPTKTGIQVVSANLILKKATDPIIWKGPMVSGAIKQFWTDIVYENVDYMFVDMPPGTGDVPLTVFQTLPVDGVLIVSSPQDLVAMIVEKAVNMTQLMGLPILGLIENMSYFQAPDTGHVYEIFGHSQIDQVAERAGLDLLAKLPLDPSVAEKVDQGRIEDVEVSPLAGLVKKLETL